MLKLSDNPPMRPPEIRSIRELTGTWWVAHTKARNEKAFAWDLVRRGVGHFLPMIEKITFSGGRRRQNLVPVFGGYVFFCGSDEDRYHAMCTGRLCQTIPANNRPEFVGELAQIEAALDAAADLTLYPHLAIGRRVRVTDGPMRNVIGTVVERRDATAGATGPAIIVLNVSLLGHGAAISVAPSLLAPVKEEDEFEAPADPARNAQSRARSYEIIDPPPRRSATAVGGG